MVRAVRDVLIVSLRTQGYSAAQVAQLLNLTKRTVVRRLALADRADEDDLDPADPPPMRMDRW